jgi:hypothetical protein
MGSIPRYCIENYIGWIFIIQSKYQYYIGNYIGW